MGCSNKNYGYRPFNECSKKHSNSSCSCHSCGCSKSGSVSNYENYIDLDGKKYNISNKNYYDNYYTKYNNYYITDYNYVTDHYFDYNIYHYDTKTIYNGCEYMGCESVVCDCHCKYCSKNYNCNNDCRQKCGWGKCYKKNYNY